MFSSDMQQSQPMLTTTVFAGRVQHKLVSGSHRHYFSTPDISQGVRKVRHVETAHPFDRKDVHLQGSLKHLDRASKEQADVVAFNRGSQSSVSRRQKQIETVDSLAPVLPVATKKSWMPPQLRQALVELSDLRIYTDTVFIIFSISSFLGMIAFYIPFMFISDYAVRNFETERDMASFLISGIGLTNIFGRLFWGWLADRPNMDPLIIYNACILLVGVVLGFVPLCTDYTGLMAVCVVFGFFVCKCRKEMGTCRDWELAKHVASSSPFTKSRILDAGYRSRFCLPRNFV